MQLIQKETTIKLNNKQQLKQLICLSLSQVLIIKEKSLHLYDINEGLVIWDQTLSDWHQQEINWKQSRVIEAVYHTKMKMLYMLISMSNCTNNEKHLNWGLFALSLGVNNAVPQKLNSFHSNPTKNSEMELKPRLIPLLKSQYLILLRQFYNESQVTAFCNNKTNAEFFLNQENLSEYNDTDTVVSYRAIFNNSIQWELFDVTQKKETLSIMTTDSGTVICIKQVSLPALKHYKTWKKQQQQMSQTGDKFTLIIANSRSKSIIYYIYSNKHNEIVTSVCFPPNPNSLVLSFLIVCGHKVHSLQRVGHQNVLVSQSYCSATENSPNHEREFSYLEVDEDLYQWSAFKLSSHHDDEFVIVNYSQSLRHADQIKCMLYRSLGKKEALLSLANTLALPDCLTKDILALTL